MVEYIGDKSDFYDGGLEEAPISIYICPMCHFELDVYMRYDYRSSRFVPIDITDTICQNCDEVYMDKL